MFHLFLTIDPKSYILAQNAKRRIGNPVWYDSVFDSAGVSSPNFPKPFISTIVQRVAHFSWKKK